ncbi:MAG TPA: VOC family protein [Actinomycetota bacterium]|nr:VOC family protein [Actinomycetota bacterium]
MGAKVVHFEITTNHQPEELQRFYADTFGWNVIAAPMPDAPDMSYGLIDAADAGIGGGIGGTAGGDMPGHVTFYLQVPDPQATLQQIESRGGKILMPPEEIVPGTTIALFQDPHGNMVGLTKGE